MTDLSEEVVMNDRNDCLIFAKDSCKEHIRNVDNYCNNCWKKATLKNLSPRSEND